MKRASGLLVLCSGLALAFLMIGVGALAIRNHAPTRNSVETTIVSSSGQRIATFFDGLPHSPKSSLKTLLAARSALPKCGKKQEKAGIYQRLFSSPVVHAGGGICLDTFCGGTGWVQFNDSCNTGGPCSGNYIRVTYDGQSSAGFAEFSEHCGTIAACGCFELTC